MDETTPAGQPVAEKPAASKSAAEKPAAAKPAAPRKKPRPLPSPLAVITGALGLFFVVLTLLAIQVRNGRDPALGPGPVVPALTQQTTAKGGTEATTQAAAIVTRTSPAPPP